MSCRECGCFTLFKEICSSCQRASLVFDEFEVNSYAAPEVKPRSNDATSLDLINVLPSSDEAHPFVVEPESTTVEPSELEETDHIPDESATSEKVTAVAARLGIDLADLHGVFDINELSADIANAATPDPVILVACQKCGQKIKQNIKCPYCGFANNNC